MLVDGSEKNEQHFYQPGGPIKTSTSQAFAERAQNEQVSRSPTRSSPSSPTTSQSAAPSARTRRLERAQHLTQVIKDLP